MSSGGVTGEPPLPESQVMPWQACQTDAMIRDQLRQLRDVRLQQQGRAMTAAEEEAFLLQLQVRSAALNALTEAQNEHYRQMAPPEAASGTPTQHSRHAPPHLRPDERTPADAASLLMTVPPLAPPKPPPQSVAISAQALVRGDRGFEWDPSSHSRLPSCPPHSLPLLFLVGPSDHASNAERSSGDHFIVDLGAACRQHREP